MTSIDGESSGDANCPNSRKFPLALTICTGLLPVLAIPSHVHENLISQAQGGMCIACCGDGVFSSAERQTGCNECVINAVLTKLFKRQPDNPWVHCSNCCKEFGYDAGPTKCMCNEIIPLYLVKRRGWPVLVYESHRTHHCVSDNRKHSSYQGSTRNSPLIQVGSPMWS